MNKKLFKVIFATIIITIIILVIAIVFKIDKEEEINEYIPEEEISEEQSRQTLVTLYFKNQNSEEIIPEARLIDAKLLLENPYITLIDLLIQGPKSEKLEKLIPSDTKINKSEINKGVVTLDLSKEFINGATVGEEEKIINSIVNTLFELTEVTGVRINIDGEENLSFQNGEINLNNIFTKTSD